MGSPKTRIENASQSLWFCNIQLRVCVCVLWAPWPREWKMAECRFIFNHLACRKNVEEKEEEKSLTSLGGIKKKIECYSTCFPVPFFVPSYLFATPFALAWPLVVAWCPLPDKRGAFSDEGSAASSGSSSLSLRSSSAML